MAERHPQQRAAPPVSAEAVAAHHDGRRHALEARDLYRVAGLVFLLALAWRFFDQLARVFLLAYAAAILAVGVNAILGWIPVRRKWLAALTGLAVVGAVVLLLWLGAPRLLEQVRNLAGMGPGLDAKLQEWEGAIRRSTGLAVDLPSPQRLFSGGSQGSGGEMLGRAIGAVEILFIPLIVFFGGLFALASPNDRLLTPLLRAVRPELRPAFYRIFQLLGERLVGWLRGVLVAMVVVGVLNVLLLTILGVPNALLLGMLNGVLEFIPLVGPWLGGGISTLAALLDDPSKAVWVALGALAIQQIELNLITPFVMSRSAEIHPFITLFALLLFGGMFGFLGMLLALPIVLLVWTVVQVLWVERTIDTDRDRIAPVVAE